MRTKHLNLPLDCIGSSILLRLAKTNSGFSLIEIATLCDVTLDEGEEKFSDYGERLQTLRNAIRIMEGSGLLKRSVG